MAGNQVLADPRASFETQTPEWTKLSSAIRFGEGTLGDAGYSTMFGGSVFEDFDDHPRQIAQAMLHIRCSWSYSSSTTYQPIADNLSLNDFTPIVKKRPLSRRREVPRRTDHHRNGADVLAALAPIWANLPNKKVCLSTVNQSNQLTNFGKFTNLTNVF